MNRNEEVNEGSMYLYAWVAAYGKRIMKFGQTFVKAGEDPDTKVWRRIKDHGDSDLVTKDKVKYKFWDAGQEAYDMGLNYPNAKYDDLVRKAVPLLKASLIPGTRERHAVDFDEAVVVISEYLGKQTERTAEVSLDGEWGGIYREAKQKMIQLLGSPQPVLHPVWASQPSILLNLPTGTGKTLMGCLLAKEHLKDSGDSVLVTTPMPATLDSAFAPDLQKFKGFEGFGVVRVDSSGSDILEPCTNGKNNWYILVSLPALKTTSSEGEGEDSSSQDATTSKNIKKFCDDKGLTLQVWIADECHTGTNTMKTRKAVDKLVKLVSHGLEAALLIGLSATAETCSDYFGESILYNEADRKDWGGRFDHLPKILVTKVDPLRADSEFTKKALETGNKDKEYDTITPDTVSWIIDKMMNPPTPVLDLMQQKPASSPSYGCEKGLLGSLCWIETIEKADKACEELVRYQNKLEVIRCYGNTAPSPKKINEEIKKNRENGKHTVILTCGRHTTGVNIPELTEIVFFDKTKSLTFVRQFIGRLARIGGAIQKTVVFATHDMMIEHRNHQIMLDVWDGKYEELKPEEMLELANSRCLPPFDPNKSDLYELSSPEGIFDLVREIKNQAVFERGTLKIDDASLLSSFDNWKDTARYCSGLKKLKSDKAGSLEIQASDSTNLPRGGSRKTGSKASGSELPQGKSQKDELDKLRRAVNALYGMIHQCACKGTLTNDNANSPSDVLEILKSHNAFDTWGVDQPLIENVANGMRDGLVPLLAQNMVAAVEHQHYPILNPFMPSDTPRHMPPKLGNEMLDKLPEDLWADSSKAFIDPACGTGILLSECARRLLRNGHRPENVIGRIFGLALSELFAAQARLNLKRVFKDEADYDLTDKQLRVIIIHRDALACERGQNMKFDVVVMNPPYNKPVHKDGRKGGYGGRSLWDKFLEMAIDDLVKDHGHLVSVNPSAWRKPESDRSKTLFRKLCHENHMQYLEIHSKADGNKAFGASTRFDFFCIQKIQNDALTVIQDEKGGKHSVDLNRRGWLPNFEFELFDKLMASEGEETCEVIFSRSAYGSDKKNISTEQSNLFPYSVVHSMTLKGIRYIYSSKNTSGHFGQPKVILSFNERQQCPVNDHKGELGMSQISFGIPVKSEADGDKLIEFIESEDGRNLVLASKWSTFQTDWRMFKYFKEGFWR